MKLPPTEYFLKAMEALKEKNICKGYPCICQESSLMLYIWLKSQNIECNIIFGDYKDPVINYNSPHFWIEAENMIIDGSAIQFELPNYDRPYDYYELKNITNISNCSMTYSSNDKNYINKVPAYIHNRMKFFINDMIIREYDSFNDFIDYIKKKIYMEIEEDFKFSMFSSLCKNNMEYYNLSYNQFVEKCVSQGIKDSIKYIKQY